MAANFSRVRTSRRANTTSGVRRGFAAVALAAGITGMATLGMAAVISSPAGAAPGNNGTVKIQGVGTVDGTPDNAPHQGCSFTVEWWNFDQAASATVSFSMQAPTKGSVSVSGNTSPSFSGGKGLDHVEAYTLTPDASIVPQANQGYHVTLTVHTTMSKGNDVKHKTFWFAGCVSTVPSSSTAPTSATTATTATSATTIATGTSSAAAGTPIGQSPTLPTNGASGPTEGESVATPTASASESATPQPGAVVPTRIESGLVSLPTGGQQHSDRGLLLALSGLSAALGAIGLLPRRRTRRS